MDNKTYVELHRDTMELALSQAVNDVISTKPADPLMTMAQAMLSTAATSAGEATSVEGRIEALRAFVLMTSAALRDASSTIIELQTSEGAASNRTGFLRSLMEQVGRKPERTWQDEWVAARAETNRIRAFHKEPHRSAPEYVREKEPIESRQTTFAKDIQALEAAGWPHDEAEAFVLISNCLDTAVAAALKEDSPRHAACTYVLCGALFRAAQRQVAAREGSEEAPPMRRCYKNLHGDMSLALADPAWAGLEQADRTGFCGLTSAAPVLAFDDPGCFTPEGFAIEINTKYKPVDSDVVCFESAPPDDHGAHEAVWVAKHKAAFPPNTLFRLVGVEPSFEVTFDAPGDGDGEPTTTKTVRVNRRLLRVRAVYRAPEDAAATLDASAGGKFAQAAGPLQYADRAAYIKGLERELVSAPVLSMRDEFGRDVTWVDWRGVSYSSRAEWAYVTGPAEAKRECTPGTRDEHNAGVTPEGFREKANARIRAALEGKSSTVTGQMPLEYAQLTLEEVLAVRLYSGPAYQLINGFLRQLSPLRGEHRVALVRDPLLSYAATVGHLCDAVRKLAAATPADEADTPLYRGVRGELAPGFWAPDDSGMVCATDTAFMSTSRVRSTPIAYMGSGHNVLWELLPSGPSDGAYHRGADISLLSQFGGEAEVLFPPMTMLVVMKSSASKKGSTKTLTAEAAAAGGADDARFKLEVVNDEADGWKFMSIKVRPCFV